MIVRGTVPALVGVMLTELNVPAPYEPDPIVAVVEIKFLVVKLPRVLSQVRVDEAPNTPLLLNWIWPFEPAGFVTIPNDVVAI